MTKSGEASKRRITEAADSGSDADDRPTAKREKRSETNVQRNAKAFKGQGNEREQKGLILAGAQNRLAEIVQRLQPEADHQDNDNALEGVKALIEAKLVKLAAQQTHEHPRVLFNEAYKQAYLEEYTKTAHSGQAEILRNLNDIQSTSLNMIREEMAPEEKADSQQQVAGARDAQSKEDRKRELRTLTDEIETSKDRSGPLNEVQQDTFKRHLTNISDSKARQLKTETDAVNVGRLDADRKLIKAFQAELARPLDTGHVPELESYINMRKRDQDKLQEQIDTSTEILSEKETLQKKSQAISNEIEILHKMLKPLKAKQRQDFETSLSASLQKKTRELNAHQEQLEAITRSGESTTLEEGARSRQTQRPEVKIITNKIKTLKADIENLATFDSDSSRSFDRSDIPHIESYITLYRRDQEDVQKLVNFIEKRNNTADNNILKNKKEEIETLASQIETLQSVHRSLKVHEGEGRQQEKENVYRLVGHAFFKFKVSDEAHIDQIASQTYEDLDDRKAEQKYGAHYKNLYDELHVTGNTKIDSEQKWANLQRVMQDYEKVLKNNKEYLLKKIEGSQDSSEYEEDITSINQSIEALQISMSRANLIKGYKDQKEVLLLTGTRLQDAKATISRMDEFSTQAEVTEMYALIKREGAQLFSIKPGFQRAWEGSSTPGRADATSFTTPNATPQIIRSGLTVQERQEIVDIRASSQTEHTSMQDSSRKITSKIFNLFNEKNQHNQKKASEEAKKANEILQRLKVEQETSPVIKSLMSKELKKPIDADTIKLIESFKDKFNDDVTRLDAFHQTAKNRLMEMRVWDRYVWQDKDCIRAQVALAKDFLRSPEVQRFLGSLPNQQGEPLRKAWEREVRHADSKIKNLQNHCEQTKKQTVEYAAELAKIKKELTKREVDYEELQGNFNAVVPDSYHD